MSAGFPIVSVTGPRQSGKTVLVKATFPKKPYVSLEDPDMRELVDADPRGFLQRYRGGLVIDEAQRSPKLFSYLQTITDEYGKPGQFVLTGSQQFGLLSGISQSLAGRVGILQLLPFSIAELRAASVGLPDLDRLLFRGLYPALYDRKLIPQHWYASYVMTYVERDLRQLLNVRELATFQRFLRMCAARVGQLLNLSSLAIDCGITHNTARNWLSVLEASYLVYLLQPHFRNFGKRLVKTPKLYFYDPGLAAWLLNIQNPDHLSVHPQRGGLFECLVAGELLKARYHRGLTSNLYFWRNNTGEEVDLIVDRGDELFPVEIKSGRTLNADLLTGLDRWRGISGSTSGGCLVYGGNESLQRRETRIVSWHDLDAARLVGG
ncbi:MAG: AAA family ATPase [Spirochaetes bacterium RBG_13_68_11]|nr:MAG: AAA family ATPase [Spirochaetes bacterium RBG_13_68_11]